jgi:hypothetical protein
MRRHKNELAKENVGRRTTKIEDTSISPFKPVFGFAGVFAEPNGEITSAKG